MQTEVTRSAAYPDPIERTERRVDDTIDLFELVATLWEGKWVIIGACLVALAVAGGGLLLQTPVYEGRAVVEIGQVADGELLFDRGRLVRQLEEVHVNQVGTDAEQSGRLTAIVTVRNGSDRALEFIAQGDDPAGVQRWLEAFVSELLAAHAQVYEERLQLVYASLDELAERKAEIETMLSALQDDVASSIDPIVRVTLALQQSGLLVERGQLFLRRLAIEESLQGHISYPSRLWGTVMVSETVTPRAQVILIVAVLLGGMLGSMAVLIRRQWLQRSAMQ